MRQIRMGVMPHFCRSFAGNVIAGEHRGYRPCHILLDSSTAEHVDEELWNRLAIADRLLSQSGLYGGMWLNSIVSESRVHLDSVEALTRSRLVSDVAELTHGVALIRARARQLEYDNELIDEL